MMKDKYNKIDRRGFIKTVGAAGLAPAFAEVTIASSAGAKTGQNEPGAPEKTQKPKYPQVPRRKLGKTGVDVPCLSLGTAFDTIENQIVLRKALQLGVDYWDTAHRYAGGNSELGIGKYLSKNPEMRKKMFLVTKSVGSITIADVEKRLQDSLKRMNTTYLDLFHIVDFTKPRSGSGDPGLSDPAQLTDEVRRWAESAKKRKLIRFLGISTHGNMAKCLSAAAKLGWIDVAMLLYNFRMIRDAKLEAAIDACHKAGIGLIAMKTQALWPKPKKDEKMSGHFLQRGFTEGQAKIKIVLEDKRFSSACVGMDNIAHLTSNAAATLDKTKLTQVDRDILRQYAKATCSGYCAGCADICNAALADVPFVNDIMRYLMYYNSYGEHDTARELFAQIPNDVRGKLLRTDYRTAEARCPQHLPIAKLVAEAVDKLT